MTGLRNLFSINPIIVKEIRSRMRGPRAFLTLTLILVLMGATMFGVLQLILVNSSMGGNILSPQIGQALFAVLAFMELFMICAITPAVTAGAISGEKEKQTYDMLLATPLSPTRILWGKLISALSYVFLLIFAGIPLASVVFIFGGVALSDMLRALVVLLGVAVAYGILGLFMSSLFGRTGRATVASFITVIMLMVGPLFVAVLVGALRNSEPPRWILAPSPISALSAALAAGIGTNNSVGSIFYALSGVFNLGVQTVSTTSIPRPLYHYSVPFYVVMTVVLYLLSTRLVRPTRRWRMRWTEWAVGVVTLLGLAGVIAAGFFLTTSRYERAVATGAQNPVTLPAQQVGPFAPAGAAVQKQVVVAQPVDTPTFVPSSTPASPPKVAVMGTSSVNPETPPSGIDDAGQVEIYAAIAGQLFTKDNTYNGGSPGWTILYLVNITDDTVGDPATAKDAAQTIKQPIQAAVADQLIRDLKVKAVWITSNQDAPIDAKTGSVASDHGVIIHFGNPHPQKDGSVQVPASLYFASSGGTGKTYILAKSDGVWKITGTTGAGWTN